MHRTLVLMLSLSCLALRAAQACEQCQSPETLLCACPAPHGLLDVFTDGEEEPLDAFRLQGGGWTFTSSGAANPFQPTKVTWSIVPNGTVLPSGLGEPFGTSNLISFLDTIHHGGPGPGGTDLTQRAWFGLFNSSFERWDELSGLTVTHEPRDDGVTVASGNVGILNRRGDHRIGGHSIDGQISPTFLAYNYFPNHSDMVIDTDEINRWGNPEGNFLRFRNMLMHEFGHGLGIQHLSSGDANFLMEPFLAVTFDGPQLDDILGIHRLYGDVNESGNGNDNYVYATSLGPVTFGQTVAVGSDAADVVVTPDEVDFVSIDASSDVDYFKFSILAPSRVAVALTPLGPTYLEGPQGGLETPFETAKKSNLTLNLWSTNGTTLLKSVNEGGLGAPELIEEFPLLAPGDYYVSVMGSENAPQFYELGLSNVSVPEPATFWLMALCCGGFARRRLAIRSS